MTPHIHPTCTDENFIVTDKENISFWMPSPAEIQCLIAGGSIAVKCTDDEQHVFAVTPEDLSYYQTARTPEDAMQLLPIAMRHGLELKILLHDFATLLAQKLPNDPAVNDLINQFIDMTAQPKTVQKSA